MLFSVAEANFLCCLHICPFDDMSPVGGKSKQRFCVEYGWWDSEMAIDLINPGPKQTRTADIEKP